MSINLLCMPQHHMAVSNVTDTRARSGTHVAYVVASRGLGLDDASGFCMEGG